MAIQGFLNLIGVGNAVPPAPPQIPIPAAPQPILPEPVQEQIQGDHYMAAPVVPAVGPLRFPPNQPAQGNAGAAGGVAGGLDGLGALAYILRDQQGAANALRDVFQGALRQAIMQPVIPELTELQTALEYLRAPVPPSHEDCATVSRLIDFFAPVQQNQLVNNAQILRLMPRLRDRQGNPVDQVRIEAAIRRLIELKGLLEAPRQFNINNAEHANLLQQTITFIDLTRLSNGGILAEGLRQVNDGLNRNPNQPLAQLWQHLNAAVQDPANRDSAQVAQITLGNALQNRVAILDAVEPLVPAREQILRDALAVLAPVARGEAPPANAAEALTQARALIETYYRSQRVQQAQQGIAPRLANEIRQGAIDPAIPRIQQAIEGAIQNGARGALVDLNAEVNRDPNTPINQARQNLNAVILGQGNIAETRDRARIAIDNLLQARDLVLNPIRILPVPEEAALRDALDVLPLMGAANQPEDAAARLRAAFDVIDRYLQLEGQRHQPGGQGLGAGLAQVLNNRLIAPLAGQIRHDVVPQFQGAIRNGARDVFADLNAELNRDANSPIVQARQHLNAVILRQGNIAETRDRARIAIDYLLHNRALVLNHLEVLPAPAERRLQEAIDVLPRMGAGDQPQDAMVKLQAALEVIDRYIQLEGQRNQPGPQGQGIAAGFAQNMRNGIAAPFADHIRNDVVPQLVGQVRELFPHAANALGNGLAQGAVRIAGNVFGRGNAAPVAPNQPAVDPQPVNPVVQPPAENPGAQLPAGNPVQGELPVGDLVRGLVGQLAGWIAGGIRGQARDWVVDAFVWAIRQGQPTVEQDQNLHDEIGRVLANLERARGAGNWEALLQQLQRIIDGGEDGRILQIVWAGFRLPAFNPGNRLQNAAGHIYRENLAALPNPAGQLPFPYRQAIEVEKHRFVQDLKAMSAMQMVNRWVCGNKIDSNQFPTLLRNGHSSAQFDAEVKTRFFAEIERLPLNRFNKWIAKVIYSFVVSISGGILERFSKGFVDKIDTYIQNPGNNHAQFRNFQNLTLNNMNDFLRILQGRMQHAAVNPEAYARNEAMIERELGEPRFNHGYKKEQLYSKAIAKAVNDLLPPKGWKANFEKWNDQFKPVPAFFFRYTAGLAIGIVESIANGFTRIILRAVLSRSKALDRVIDMSVQHVRDRNGYTHAVNKMILNLLDKIDDRLENGNLQDGQQQVPIANKEALRELVRNLFVVLRVQIPGGQLAAKQIVDVLAELIGAAYQSAMQPNQVHKPIYDLFATFRAAIENPAVNDEDMLNVERDVSRMSDSVLQKAVNVVVQRYTRFNPVQAQESAQEFLRQVQQKTHEMIDHLTPLIQQGRGQAGWDNALTEHLRRYQEEMRDLQRNVSGNPHLKEDTEMFDRKYSRLIALKASELQNALYNPAREPQAVRDPLVVLQEFRALVDGFRPIQYVNVQLPMIGWIEGIVQWAGFNAGKEMVREVWQATRTPYWWRFGLWHHSLLLPYVEGRFVNDPNPN